jgi:hypothetical protein
VKHRPRLFQGFQKIGGGFQAVEVPLTVDISNPDGDGVAENRSAKEREQRIHDQRKILGRDLHRTEHQTTRGIWSLDFNGDGREKKYASG